MRNISSFSSSFTWKILKLIWPFLDASFESVNLPFFGGSIKVLRFHRHVACVFQIHVLGQSRHPDPDGWGCVQCSHGMKRSESFHFQRISVSHVNSHWKSIISQDEASQFGKNSWSRIRDFGGFALVAAQWRNMYKDGHSFLVRSMFEDCVVAI